MCSSVPLSHLPRQPHTFHLKSLLSLLCPGEHFTVVLPVRILFIYWDEAQPSSLLKVCLSGPQLKGPSPCILNLPSTPVSSAGLLGLTHLQMGAVGISLLAFPVSLGLSPEGRDYTLLLTHLLDWSLWPSVSSITGSVLFLIHISGGQL